MGIEELYEIEGCELFKNSGIDYGNMRDPSCATPSQIGYLMAVIENHKFKNGDNVRNAMEVGVCTGLSSLYMLRAGSRREDFCLYGIEKGQGEFFGHAVFERATEQEKARWRFCPGHTTYDIERILRGGKSST